MERSSVLEILRIGHEILKSGTPELHDRVHALGMMFYGASEHDRQASQLAAAMLGVPLVDLSWSDAGAKSSRLLLEEVRMASKAVDLLVTCFSESETFGDGYEVSRGFSSASDVPVVNVADDILGWQSALTHLLGFEERRGDLSGRQLVVSWGFGSSFSRPTTAHSLVLGGLMVGANVRIVSPPEFSLMNRIRSKATKQASDLGLTFEQLHEFDGALAGADAIFASNWLRLDDYNHPERHWASAKEYQDWCITPDNLPQDCIFSTEPPLQPELLYSPAMVEDPRNITSGWLSRRAITLAASTLHSLR